MSVPTRMNAVINKEGKMVLTENVPVPKLTETSILVKTKAVGSNPFDALLVDYKLAPENCILGSDVVGEIVQIGSRVDSNEFHVGDIVSGVITGGTVEFPDNGAFAEYVRMDPNTVFKISQRLTHSNKNTVESNDFNSWESCASFPMVAYTAFAGTFYQLKLKLDWLPENPQNDHPILIWGGATGVGQYAIQFIKKVHGFTKIIVVASKKHEALLKSFGADEVFDYHDEDIVEQITSKYDNLQTLMDCRSLPETINQTYQCASKTGKVILMEYVPDFVNCIEEKNKRDNVEITTTSLYQMNDIPLTLGSSSIPTDLNYRAKIIECIKFFNPRFVNGDIKHTPLKIYKGLNGAIKMVDDIRQNKNSAFIEMAKKGPE